MKVSGYDRRKVIRSILQGIGLAILLFLILRALISFDKYEPYKGETASTTDSGFIAISYFGVEREGDDTLISTKRLEEHLQALYDQGYVTISQQDILDYYEQGKPLPEKSLYLMFEDGRRDTAIFAQAIMEKYNFKATMMSYAERYSDDQSKFLGLEDLKDLEDSTFWELGTNGYRLSYINVFDKEDNYLGNMDSLTFNAISDTLGRDYNHYLMDFERDEDGVPTESRSQMEQRLSYDYEQMEKIYLEGLGKIPSTYVLMHSNTGAFGNNDKASAVNQEWIYKLFDMNFNREGYCKNTPDSSIYDLTRMQPQSYWPTNHLLMRVKNDTGMEVTFVEGDTKKTDDWIVEKGALEYQDEAFFLTSEAKDCGRIRLNEMEDCDDQAVHVRMNGNKIGSQKVYVRADEDMSNYVSVEMKDAEVIVQACANGSEQELYRAYLEDVEPEEIDIREEGDYTFWIKIKDNQLTVSLNNETLVDNKTLSAAGSGKVVLESGWSDGGWSQRNLADDVYDGIFREVYVTEGDEKADVVYNGRYAGVSKAAFETKKAWDAVVNWFIKYL